MRTKEIHERLCKTAAAVCPASSGRTVSPKGGEGLSLLTDVPVNQTSRYSQELLGHPREYLLNDPQVPCLPVQGAVWKCKYTKGLERGAHLSLKLMRPGLSASVRPKSKICAFVDFAAAMALQSNKGVGAKIVVASVRAANTL